MTPSSIAKTATGSFAIFSITCLVLIPALGNQAPQPPENSGALRIADVFSPGWMLKDTNGDGVVDFIEGKIVVGSNPTAAENAAAANMAARLAFGTTGLTLPLVISTAAPGAEGPRIFVGKVSDTAEWKAITQRLEKDEGGVVTGNGNLAVIGHDDAGLTATAEAFSARAPYIWKVPGEQISALLSEINRGPAGRKIEITGITYLKGKAGINRVYLRGVNPPSQAELQAVLKLPRFAAVHELVVLGAAQEVTAVNTRPLPAWPTPSATAVANELANLPATVTRAGNRAISPNPGAGASTLPRGSTEPESAAAAESTGTATSDAAGESNAGGESAGSVGGTDAEGATPQPLDLASVYTSRGLFKGTPKMPIPSASDGQLYVQAGPAGIEMANLAARMGMETTGLALPIAKAANEVKLRDVRTKAVVPENTDIGREITKKLIVEDTANAQAESPLAAGEGELRIVDRAFNKLSAVLVRGDEAGSKAALAYLNARLPNLWETGKQYGSIEELRYDLHRFFSLRSSAGQAAVSLYHLDEWAKELKASGDKTTRDITAEVYVDVADLGLEGLIRKQLQTNLGGANVNVKVASLHSGTQCCSANPPVHYQQPGLTFQQGKPTFEEDLTIPWEGNRLLKLVTDALHDVKKNAPVTLTALVSEGPEVREKLRAQLTEMLRKRGVAAENADVQVLCAFKQGYSWLLDGIAPKLAGKPVERIKIEFAKDVDPTGMRVMYSPARWVQELYPVDEILAKKLNIPLKNVELSEFEPAAGSPSYRVHAYDGSGKEITSSEFSVATALRPYNGVMPEYEQVQVETGWIKLKSGGSTILDQRIKTDIEEFWEHYQEQTLPKVFHTVMAQSKGDLRPEFAPIFDTLRLDIHMSEPNYAIGLDKERISTLEALQEDTFYSTENFANMIGNLEAGRPVNYVGRIVPVVHDSEDGKDGRVHIEFFAKPAANPSVRLSWTDSEGHRHERERDLPVLTGAMQPRLVRARLKSGAETVDDLMWILSADYQNDDFEQWIKLEPREQVERSIFSVAQAKSQIHWLAEMHAAGLYRDELSYPHLNHLSFEFELPVPRDKKAESPAPRAFAAFAVNPPATTRPMISQFASAKETNPIVQWDEPISPDENTAILAQLAKHPGVSVYWMGRTYLGRDIWAADFTLPTPAQLRSQSKETTLKATIYYSGRQHANEVSSTSHLDKLGEQLVSDPETRALLKQVNVVLHPIDNPDGAELSVQLAKVTPDNLLHPGYHGALAADVSTGQAEADPVYPESRTRRQLLEGWLPDAFLNPHGYPSHEWVQPFSEYTGWVQTREGANPGRAWWIPRGWFTA